MNTKILSEIWLYPIKSLPGVRVKSANVSEKGLVGDRRLMLIDENNSFMTQRSLPQMALFDVQYDGTIHVRSKSNARIGSLSIDPAAKSLEKISATIWDDEVDVVEVNPAFSSWFSDALEMKCKLVFFPEENLRRLDPEYVKDEQQVSLADGYPYLIIGNSSLKDLNEKVGAELSMKRFRPNFVFEGGNAFEEDDWQKFNMGSVQFLGIKPCARCALPTIDPETGTRGDEPLRTLSTYRKRNGKIYFGQNVIVLNTGEIIEGDEIHLQ